MFPQRIIFPLLGFLPTVLSAPAYLSKRDDDNEEEEEDDDDDTSSQTIALIVTFSVIGFLLLLVTLMIIYHFTKKRRLLTSQPKTPRSSSSTAFSPSLAEKKSHDDEPSCPWCYIADNRLCKWCSTPETGTDESAGTTVYGGTVIESRRQSAEEVMVEGKHSFRPGVGVYAISSPAPSCKGKERAVETVVERPAENGEILPVTKGGEMEELVI